MSTTEHYPDGTGLTFEKVWAMFQENDRKFNETKPFIKDPQEHTKQSLTKLDARIRHACE